MPNYKKHRIELIPRRQADWTWQCLYTIIEFRPTCWAYHEGCPDRSFTSRQEATMAALEKAKRIVDSLEPPAQGLLFEAGSIGRLYGNSLRRLTFLLSRSRALVNTIMIMAGSPFARHERKPT